MHTPSAIDALETPPHALPADRLSRIARLWLLAVVLATSGAVALLVDVPLARLLEAGAIPGDVDRLIALSEAFAHGSGVVLILLGAAALDTRTWRVLPRLLIGAFGAGLCADVFKLVLGRTRPKYFDFELEVWDSFLGPLSWRSAATWQEAFSHQVQSFPSGHAATAAGLACALSRFYPRATWFFALMTALACFQRIESGAHYLSDVLAGAALGVAINALLELPRARRWLARVEGNGARFLLDANG